MRRLAEVTLVAVAVGMTAARAANAQDAQGAPQAANETAPIVHYGKWGAAALFAVFTSLGAIEHNAADDHFRSLQAYCVTSGSCRIGPDGRYTDPGAESRYQSVVHGDRAARAWFFSGQIALGGAAALFVIELMHDHGTQNIPYSGLVVTPGSMGTTKVGWRVPLP